MQITAGEKRTGGNSGPKSIGYFRGTLTHVNPTASQLKKLYEMEEDPEEVKYQGEDKNGKQWALVNFVFEEEISKKPVSYRIFFSKEVAEFEVEGKMRTWYINQFGESQLVYDKKELFRSFTHLQKWNKDAKKMEDVLIDDSPVELSWRKAYKGETALYSLIRNLVTQNWYDADADTNVFIKIDDLMAGNVKAISSFIGTENFQSVVGMLEIQAKDGDNGINYYQNCVDQAWMPGGKMGEANLITNSNGWSKYDSKDNSKGKNRQLYQFYQAVKRNKHITEFKPMHEFSPDSHIAAGNSVIQHDTQTVNNDTDY